MYFSIYIYIKSKRILLQYARRKLPPFSLDCVELQKVLRLCILPAFIFVEMRLFISINREINRCGKQKDTKDTMLFINPRQENKLISKWALMCYIALVCSGLFHIMFLFNLFSTERVTFRALSLFCI